MATGQPIGAAILDRMLGGVLGPSAPAHRASA
jgi:hypothetical protein